VKRLILLCFPATVLFGCGPIYDTTYTFIPPEDNRGQICTFQCENSKSQCIQLEEMKESNCQSRSDAQRYICEERIRAQYGREPKWYECGGETCSADEARCESQYRSCYQACGGRVIAETRCIANCAQSVGKQ
jgi:hypothetical protein